MYFNFADDMHVLAHTLVSMSYSCSVVASEYASATQFLHPSKSEVLFPEGHPSPKVSVCTHEEVQRYVCEGERPARRPDSEMKATNSFVVLGSKISSPQAQEASCPIVRVLHGSHTLASRRNSFSSTRHTTNASR